MKQKIIILSLFSLLVAFIVLPAFAQTGSLREKIRNSSTAANMPEYQQNKTQTVTTNLKDRADQEITRRLTSLQNLLTRISEFKKLSTTQKSSLTTQVQAEIAALTTLQAKINADTDTQTQRTDVQSIVQSYRVYALFIPQMQILGAADRMLTVTDNFTTEATTLQTKIDQAKADGKDVTELQPLLTDIQAKIADAKKQAQAAIDAVTPLTPAGYPGNATTLQSARKMLETGRNDLLLAQQDIRKMFVIYVQYRKNITPSASLSPRPSITCMPRPKCLDAVPHCMIAEPANGWCPMTTKSTNTAQ
ncbi:MAG TPA: hypothetical protein VE090_00805 [Methylomirabilota bacterium]|nr:hypothetical protein [Methylomirabilota bacterium]